MRTLFLLALATIFCCSLASGQAAASGDANPLPAIFAGWHSGAVQHQSQARAADAAEGPVLQEYGFSGFDSAEYSNASGRKITVKAIRFKDATGAYGAFTYYRQPQMAPEEIGNGGASSNNGVLFFKGNILVQVAMDRVTATTPAEMRELASSLAIAKDAGQVPDLARYLPLQSLEKQSIRYVLGPQAWERLHGPVAATAVDWRRSAEAILGNYTTGEGEATMALLYFPTPQIAGDQLRSLESQHPANADTSAPMAQLELKRVGPMVAMVGGEISQAEAKSLTASISYEADVTYNEPTFLGKKDNIGNLMIAVFSLCGIMIVLALGAGLFFGGTRVLLQRLFPKHFAAREDEATLISLNLRE